MQPLTKTYPYIREGFSILKILLRAIYPTVNLKLDDTCKDLYLCIEAQGTVPPFPLLSRVVSHALRVETYTLRIRAKPSPYSIRILSALRGSRSALSDMPMSYLYVISGYSPSTTSPLGAFTSRRHAEMVLSSGGFQDRFERDLGVDFENFVLERWEVGSFLTEPRVKRLSVHTLEGLKVLHYDEEDTTPVPSGRLTSILYGSFCASD